MLAREDHGLACVASFDCARHRPLQILLWDRPKGSFWPLAQQNRRLLWGVSRQVAAGVDIAVVRLNFLPDIYHTSRDSSQSQLRSI